MLPRPFERYNDICKQQVSSSYEANIQLVKNMVNRLNTMSTLLYEINAGTPLGKTVKILFNLYRYEGKTSGSGVINLTGISFHKLANLVEISEAELQESLNFLHQKGFIFYRPALTPEK